jgi:hypothetical protein
MCPLFFEAASSTPICCITNTTKPIFIIEKDYSSLSTQEETRQLFAEKLVHYCYGIVSRGEKFLVHGREISCK